MSFRSSKPSSRRSSSSFRNNNSNNTVPGLASYNRPRSLSFFSTSTPAITSGYAGYTSSPTSSNFHSILNSSTPFLNSYNYNAYNPYSKYSLNGYSPVNQLPTSYGGTTSGYGSISLPSKTLSALNIMPTTYGSTKNYDSSSRDYLKSSSPTNSSLTNNNDRERSRKARSMNRNGSFNRSRSASGMRDSGMGSRSVSLTSLNSEGYVVRKLYPSLY